MTKGPSEFQKKQPQPSSHQKADDNTSLNKLIRTITRIVDELVAPKIIRFIKEDISNTRAKLLKNNVIVETIEKLRDKLGQSVSDIAREYLTGEEGQQMASEQIENTTVEAIRENVCKLVIDEIQNGDADRIITAIRAEELAKMQHYMNTQFQFTVGERTCCNILQKEHIDTILNTIIERLDKLAES